MVSLGPFKRLTDFKFLLGPWTVAVLLRCPGDPRMMEGSITGAPWGGVLLAIADDGVQFTGSFEGGVSLGWWYDINDYIAGGDPSERYTVEVTVVCQLTADPANNYFLAQLNASNFPADAPHGGGIIVDTVNRSINIDGQHIPGISVPPL